MDPYGNVIDVDQLCERDRDIYDPASFPRSLNKATGILVKEDREMLPAYLRMPHPAINIAHETGLLSDAAYNKALAECGVFAKKSEIYSMKNLVEGLLCNGANVYLSSIWMSNDFESDSPAALTIEGGGWDYYFKPKVFRLGRSGRVLRDPDGNLYAEEIHIRTTPEMVWGGISGIYSERLGIHIDGGVIVVKENGKYVDSAFGETCDFRKRFRDSNFLSIDLEALPIPNGWSIEKHPLEDGLKDYEGVVFIFETSFDDWRELFSYVNATSDNIAWKALQLYHHCWSRHPDAGPGNNFFCKSFIPHNHWVFYENKAGVELGRTGREVRKADNYDDERGYEWPSNWQMQYLTLNFGRQLLLPAIFLLGNTLKRVALNKSERFDSGYQVFFDQRDPNITPENPVTIHEEPCSIDQRRREQPSQVDFL